MHFISRSGVGMESRVEGEFGIDGFRRIDCVRMPNFKGFEEGKMRWGRSFQLRLDSLKTSPRSP